MPRGAGRKGADRRRRPARHGGSIGGTTYLAIYPDRQLVVAVVTNLTDAHDLGAEQVAEAFLDLGAR